MRLLLATSAVLSAAHDSTMVAVLLQAGISAARRQEAFLYALRG